MTENVDFPLLSVIIPTYNRPQYLSRAVRSALQAAPNGNVEIIVVPNGGDETWRESLISLLDDSRIIVSPVEKGHANVARNHGLRLARGKYIRFLDDDDYFLKGATEQIIFADQNDLEICSGYTRHCIEDGLLLERVTITNNREDFVLAVLDISGIALTTGNIFLRSSLQEAVWCEKTSRLQDQIWVLNLCCLKEWKWKHFEEDVAAWYHHDGQRISLKIHSAPTPWLADKILALYADLLISGRLNDVRQLAIAKALWNYAHNNFYFQPLFCQKIIINAFLIDPNVKAANLNIKGWLIPSLIEWFMLPKRRLNLYFRFLKQKLYKKTDVREV